METHQIRYFLAVCDQGNFTRAAQLTFVSQPSLTQAIKKLEDELGGALFTRDRTGCVLTPLGQVVEPRLRRIYNDLLHTKTEAVRFIRLKKIPVRIGLMKTIGAQKLSPCLAQYQQEHPHVELEVIVDDEAKLLAQLDTKALDLVLSTSTQTLHSAYSCTPLYHERYIVLFNAAHKFKHLPGPLALKDLETEAYLDRLNCELRDNLVSVCQAQEVKLYAAYRSNSEEWILHMVRAGLGVALMPEYTLPKGASDLGYRYLAQPEIRRQIFALHLPTRSTREELTALLRQLPTH